MPKDAFRCIWLRTGRASRLNMSAELTHITFLFLPFIVNLTGIRLCSNIQTKSLNEPFLCVSPYRTVAVAVSGSCDSDCLLIIHPFIICCMTIVSFSLKEPVPVFVYYSSYVCCVPPCSTFPHQWWWQYGRVMGWDVMWNWRDAKHFHMTKCCATFSEASVAIIPVSKNTFYDTDLCIHRMTSHLQSRSVINKKETLMEDCLQQYSL